MFPADTFRTTLGKIIAILQTYKIKFHLTGGVTSVAYGEPRMTQDVDIVVDNGAVQRQLDSFIESLRISDFLFDETAIRTAVDQKQMFQLLDSVEALKLDIYPRELIPGELERSNTLELFEGMIVPIASLTDTATAKLIWISKGSHKSRRDLRQLIRISTASQRRTIEQMAADLGLRELLSEVLLESDQIDA
jgi:Nucleotidyl transferase AbiEii toxin, Type IV TA system